MIRNHVTLENGARIHPDELHRIGEDDKGTVVSHHEGLTVRDPMNRGQKAEESSFHRALSKAAAYSQRPNDQITLQSAHGYTVTRTRAEWQGVLAEVDQDPHTTFSEWFDRQEGKQEPARPVEPQAPKPHSTGGGAWDLGGERHQGTLFSRTKKGGKGIWRTIGKGAHGAKVYIVDGKITKGCAGLEGKRIDALSEDAEDDRPPDLAPGASKAEAKAHKSKLAGIHRSELNRSAGYNRAVWAKKARKEGIAPQGLHQLAAEILAHDKGFKQQKTEFLQRARELSKGRYGDLRNIKQRDARGKLDAAGVRGLDDIAQSLAEEFPGFSGDDGELYDLLVAGNPEPMSGDDAYGEALEHLTEERERYKVKEEAVPFSKQTIRMSRALRDHKETRLSRTQLASARRCFVRLSQANGARAIHRLTLLAQRDLARLKAGREVAPNGQPLEARLKALRHMLVWQEGPA